MNLIALQAVFLLTMSQVLIFIAIYDVERWGKHIAAAALSLALCVIWAKVYTMITTDNQSQPPPPPPPQ